jgi:hypothetical protein
MRRFSLFAVAAAASLGAPQVAPADSVNLMQKRDWSCGTSAFEELSGTGAETRYRHKVFGVTAPVNVGLAVLEWCQTAQNAVVYFYVDDPARRERTDCPENISVAIFPGRGEATREIISKFVPAYANPSVTLISEPQLTDIDLAVSGQCVDERQLEVVLLDAAGAVTRQKLIGFDKNGDFVRIMTGVIEQRGCRNEVTADFLARLDWPVS